MLKCWPVYFGFIKDGTKPFDVRSTSDRNFAVSDTALFREWDPMKSIYTARQVSRRITYVGIGLPGIQDNHAVLGLAEIKP